MNKDFHYEGTYAAACLAGFSPEEAGKIAWAAQTVDECTESKLKKHYDKLMCWDPVFTCQETSEIAFAEGHILSDETDGALCRLRKIWMCFHFLPGNIRGQTYYTESPELAGERDMRDFLCLCQPNGDLVREIAQHMVDEYREGEQAKELLIKIGLIMHVIADTWAHQNFAGTPNAKINDVSEFSNVKPPSSSITGYDGSHTPGVGTTYSVSYLGHGRAGHNPDYGCLTYRYKAAWCKEKIVRDGPKTFCEAFGQMVYVLKSIKEGTAIDLNAQPEAEGQPWFDIVKAIVSVPFADQSAVWRTENLNLVDFSGLAQYTFAGAGRNMRYFQKYAREHQALVLGCLEAEGNIVNTR